MTSSFRILIARLVTAVVLIDLFVIGMAIQTLSHSREVAIATAGTATLNFTRLLANQVAERIEKADLALQAVRDEYHRMQASGTIDRSAFDSYIERTRSRLPELDAIRIADADGLVVFGTEADKSAGVRVADRPHFIRLRDDPAAGLAFSDLQTSRVNGRMVQVLARRLEHLDGGFGGIVYAAIPQSRFVEVFSTVDVGAHGVTVLRGGDMTVVARYPEPKEKASPVGSRTIAPEMLRQVQAGAPVATFSVKSRLDGVERIYSYRKVGQYPFFAIVGLADTDYLAGWRRDLAWGILTLTLFIGLTIFGTFAVHRGWRRQAAAETALMTSKHRLSIALDAAHQAWWEWNVATGESVLSPRYYSMFGYEVGDFPARHAEWVKRIHPDDVQRVLAHQRSTLFEQRADRIDMTLRMCTRDGRWRWINSQARVVEREDDGTPLRLVGCTLDVTADHEQRERLRLAASVFANADEGICVTDAQERIVDINPTFCEITGYAREELIGKTPRILKSGRQGPEFYAAMWQSIAARGHWRGEVWNRRCNGDIYAERLTVSAVRSDQGEVTHYVGVLSDITLSKEQEQQLRHIAHYDMLTGVPNRFLLADRMRQASAQATRTRTLLAVCYLDLDGFKPINDLHGHATGDRLLVEIASRLKSALRGGDTVARLGGDEFVLLMQGLTEQQECEVGIRRVLAAIEQPIVIDGNTLTLSASVGISLYPIDDADADTLLRHADQAMYQAKQEGRNRYRLFDQTGEQEARTRRELLDCIAQGLRNNEFVFHYQPKVDMRRGKVVGAEALVRWQHPEHGLLPPARFLPAMEETDLIVDLGYWALETALDQLSAWRLAGLELTVSVNIAARHLQRPEFTERLQALLAMHPDLPANALELEVLETTALNDMAIVSSVIERCRVLGVSFALDDFGTGYSSLTYFRRLPADVLKIDQSFVRNMMLDPEDLAIVEGIIGLTRVFERTPVAEGVEDLETGLLLLNLGCQLAQGYAIARPMAAELLPGWIENWPDPRWAAACGTRIAREDFSVLIAEGHHRRWIREVRAYVEGESDTAPATDSRECFVGRWYRDGCARFGDCSKFRLTHALHERVHAVAQELIALTDDGQRADAGKQLPRLLTASNELLSALHELLIQQAKPPAEETSRLPSLVSS